MVEKFLHFMKLILIYKNWSDLNQKWFRHKLLYQCIIVVARSQRATNYTNVVRTSFNLFKIEASDSLVVIISSSPWKGVAKPWNLMK